MASPDGRSARDQHFRLGVRPKRALNCRTRGLPPAEVESGEQSGQSGEQCPVGGLERRAVGLASKDCYLVSERDDLDGEVGVATIGKPDELQDAAERPVEERECQFRMLAPPVASRQSQAQVATVAFSAPTRWTSLVPTQPGAGSFSPTVGRRYDGVFAGSNRDHPTRLAVDISLGAKLLGRRHPIHSCPRTTMSSSSRATQDETNLVTVAPHHASDILKGTRGIE